MVVWKGRDVEDELEDVLLEALIDMGMHIMARAQYNAPLADGYLRGSARVTVGAPPNPEATYKDALSTDGSVRPHATKGENTVYVTFSTPYARKLHEDLTWNPRDWKINDKGKRVWKAPVGGPKYLEKAALEIWPHFKHVLEEVKRERGVM